MVTKIERDRSIDLIKTMAIIGVIVIHVCSEGYTYPIASFNWISSVFLGSITRASVPLFLMGSGALLLNPEKELPIGKLFSKNILRVVVAMLAWSMLYKIYHLLDTGALSIASMWQSIKEVLLLNQESHFYYIHIIILVYAFLPVTRIFVNYANKSQLQYALCLWFAVGIIYPTVRPFYPFSLLKGIPGQWLMNMTYASIGYGVLGFYLKRYPLSLFKCIVSILAGFTSVFSLTVFMSIRRGVLYTGFLEGMTVGPAVLAIGIFGLCQHIAKTPRIGHSAFLKYISKASFCIYLIHVFFIYMLPKVGITVHILPCILSIPIITILILFLSSGAYSILVRIPLINKWLI